MDLRIVNLIDSWTGGEEAKVDRSTVLGNPFGIGRDGTRDEVIAKYREWLWGQIEERGEVWEALLRLLSRARRAGDNGLGLACWCAPKRCHAEIIRAALIWMDKQEGGKDNG